MHDPRLGRFFAVDPLAAHYPHNSSYAFSENRTIDGVELEGLEYQATALQHLNYAKVYEKKSPAARQAYLSEIMEVQKPIVMITLSVVAVVGVSYAVITYGVVAVGTYMLEEAGEYVF